MAKKRTSAKTGSSKVTITLGRARFAKISAVEGIAITPQMKKRAAEFDRQGLSAAERRASIIRAHRKG